MSVCASCQGHTTEVMNFGDVALAGGFLKESEFKGERKYPLSLEFCESCYLLQVPQKVPDSILFSDYFYFSSAIGTLRKHFKAYAAEIVERFNPQTLVEIGCNDGVLLKPLADLGVPRLIGVDPAANVVREIADDRIAVINDYFKPGLLDGKADCIVANNVFAHVSDLNGVTGAIADLLTDDGVFIFEVNRLDGMIADLQYDWVYHEHRYYYSLMALENLLGRHGLMVFDLKRVGTHAGSIRYYACREGMCEETPIVEEQRQKEIWHGLDYICRYRTFAEAAQDHRERLVALVKEANANGEIVAGYGACGRANTLLQWCGLTADDIAFIVDDAPAKQGYFTPGSHIPVVPREALQSQPEKLILFAWTFLEEIYAKCGDYEGEVIIPLPEIVRTRANDERIAA